MDGALDLAGAGIRSTLYPDNRNDPRVTAPDTANGALMFDPQTGGGLLAAVPKAKATALAKKPNVWIIGDIIDGNGVTFN
jgi:selenide,water dikinase